MSHNAPRALALSLLLVVLPACGDATTEPDSALPEATALPVDASAAAKPADAGQLASVTGGGHYVTDAGVSAQTSVSAREHKDGSVKGQMEIQNRTSGIRFHVDVSCLAVDGSQAWVAGVITQTSSETVPVGASLGVRVTDNGEGHMGSADRVSGPVPFAGAPEAFCQARPPIPDNDIDGGNFQVGG